jgi:hypothetical protein
MRDAFRVVFYEAHEAQVPSCEIFKCCESKCVILVGSFSSKVRVTLSFFYCTSMLYAKSVDILLQHTRDYTIGYWQYTKEECSHRR